MRALLFGIVLIGCTPSPERVCGWRMRLSEERFGKTDAATHRNGLKHCLDLAKRERATNPARYKCRADCALDARHLDQIFECEKNC
jgi:hypothetical protein